MYRKNQLIPVLLLEASVQFSIRHLHTTIIHTFVAVESWCWTSDKHFHWMTIFFCRIHTYIHTYGYVLHVYSWFSYGKFIEWIKLSVLAARWLLQWFWRSLRDNGKFVICPYATHSDSAPSTFEWMKCSLCRWRIAVCHNLWQML